MGAGARMASLSDAEAHERDALPIIPTGATDGCCTPSELVACCEPNDKDKCCGSATNTSTLAPMRCGCK